MIRASVRVASKDGLVVIVEVLSLEEEKIDKLA